MVLAWFAKVLTRKGWASRLVDLVAVAAFRYIEVDQLWKWRVVRILECQRNWTCMVMILGDSWWFLMLHPHFCPKDLGNHFFLVYVQYPIEVPTAFPGVFAQPVCQLFWLDGKICRRLRRPPFFTVKSMSPLKIFAPQTITWSVGNSFHRNIRCHPMSFFLHRWLGRFLASLRCRWDWVNFFKGKLGVY